MSSRLGIKVLPVSFVYGMRFANKFKIKKYTLRVWKFLESKEEFSNKNQAKLGLSGISSLRWKCEGSVSKANIASQTPCC
jgi:hypothetical protein